jgi:WS/DGAT/MGAT family acyltransferase
MTMMADQLSALDMTFLCLEDKDAPMHLGAVAVFAPRDPLDTANLVALLGERVRQVPRMRQRVRNCWLPPGGAAWADDPTFNIDNHIHVHHLRSDGRDDLAALTADLMGEALDLSRPLWQLHVITGLAGGRFAVVAKLHHALCDGYGAIGLGQRLLDGYAPAPATARQAASPPPPTAADSGHGLLPQPDQVLSAAIQTATGAVSQARTMLDIASAVLGKVRLPPHSPLLVTPSHTRQVVLANLGLPELQRIRRRHGGTLNDVLLTVVTGALRQWLTAYGHPTAGLGLRALIPASRRRRPSSGPDGNQLSGYLCDLPVGETDPALRLQRIRAEMDRNKAAGAQRGAGALPVLAGLLPPAVHRLATPLARHAAPLLFDIVVTSAPLPPLSLRLHGADLQELYPLVPLASGHALGVALSRYQDTVYVGLYANREAATDIEKFSEALSDAVTDLHESAPLT